jgi:hypothetical protein
VPTFHYRLLRASWGIAVDVDAEATVLASPPPARQVSSHVFLSVALQARTDAPATHLTADEHDWLAHGLALVAPQIESARPTGHVLVTVRGLTFNPCHYQPEGLAAALAGWAAAEFGLTCPLPSARYDKVSNRYEYEWGR